MANRQTLEEYMKDEGYTTAKFSKCQKLLWICSDRVKEEWIRNDGHASFGVTFGGHDYEFCSSLKLD